MIKIYKNHLASIEDATVVDTKFGPPDKKNNPPTKKVTPPTKK